MSKTKVQRHQQRSIQLQLPDNEELDIEFNNLRYVVSSGKGKKEVLHSICGKFNSGQLTAIMGPSGAGKSSLLNILTGFQKSGMSGSIRCSKQETKSDTLVTYKKDSCYILQDDRLFPLFTVMETMTMAASLKLGDCISKKAVDMLIMDILDMLSLSTSVNTKCSRLSGGQRKRLSIALELIDNPPIMFLDEPTTGLDSSSSLQVVSVLKNLAKGGRTIVCTIHQPSATIFEMFDHVYVMANGHCIYQGSALNTIPFLATVGLDCPKYHNPADHLIEVANGEYGDHTDKLIKVCKETDWRMSTDLKALQIESLPLDNYKKMILVKAPSEWHRFCVLFNRSVVQLFRDWTASYLKLALHIVVGIVVGILYLNYGNDASKTVKNVGYFIISLVYLNYTTMMPAILKIPSEIPVLRKENFNNWYKLRTYYVANMMAVLPMEILYATVYTLISYTITGQLLEVNRVLMFLTIAILVTVISEGYGLAIGVTVNAVNGTFIGAIYTALTLVVAGFMIIFSHMSSVMYGISYISHLAYGMEGMVQAMYAYEREDLHCPDDIEYCHYKSPSVLLRDLGMERDNYVNDVLCLVFVVLITKVLGFCSLKHKLSRTSG